MLWQYHTFCLLRCGFTHWNFTNYPLFLCFLMKKDPCTQWIKNIDIANWCHWINWWFPHSGVVVSCLLPVKIGLRHQNFTNSLFIPCFLRKIYPCTWCIKNIDIYNWCLLWAKVWFSHSFVVVSCVLPVKVWLRTWKFPKLPIFSAFSQEQRPFYIVNEK